MTTPLPVLQGRSLGAPLAIDTDVVVVGSGAGGAVAARELARAGRSVVVLEEGAYFTPEDYGAMTPTESLRRMAREAGMSVVLGRGETPVISLLSGKAVGGSSLLTGGVCFRIPEAVLARWDRELGLTAMAPERLAPFFEAVERICHVAEVPAALRSRATERFVEGAEALGFPMKAMRRNTEGCRGAARCNFGCPHGAKWSVDLAFLPDAVAHGARIVSDARVERIDVTGGRARGVVGRFLDAVTGEPRVRFHVRAKVVVVAAGSLHTPLLLRRSGLDTPAIGRHLTLHPAVRIGAIFDEEVSGWDGALQSVYSDHFVDDGIWLNGVYSAVNVVAASFPGFGRTHRRLVRKMPNVALFGGMVHDDGGGEVRRWLSSEPLVLYRMAERDRARLFRTIHILAEMAFAGGAKTVLLPIFGTPPLERERRADLDLLLEGKIPAARVECLAFHPLGSARMAREDRRQEGVVKPTGETWAVENLFVCDGSVLPTSIGVNSQLPIMSVAMMLAQGVAADFSRLARRS